MCQKKYNMLEDNLKVLGFNKKEADILIVLNQFGPNPASVISRLSRIPRTYTYDILNKLLDKNLIFHFVKNNISHYSLDDLEKILQYQKSRVSIAKNVIDDLQKRRFNTMSLDLSYYKGSEGYHRLYEEILESTPDEVLAFINYDNFSDVLDKEFEEEWTKKRVDQGAKAKLLITNSDQARRLKQLDGKFLRETRIIPEEYMFDTTFIIYDECAVVFEKNGADISGLKIKSSKTVQMFRNIFKIAWKSLEEKK